MSTNMAKNHHFFFVSMEIISWKKKSCLHWIQLKSQKSQSCEKLFQRNFCSTSHFQVCLLCVNDTERSFSHKKFERIYDIFADIFFVSMEILSWKKKKLVCIWIAKISVLKIVWVRVSSELHQNFVVRNTNMDGCMVFRIFDPGRLSHRYITSKFSPMYRVLRSLFFIYSNTCEKNMLL